MSALRYSAALCVVATLGCTESVVNRTDPDASVSRDASSESSNGPLHDALPPHADRSAPEKDARGIHEAGLEASLDAAPVHDLLSATGLYSDTAKGELSPDVETYEPQGVLWADGAAKKRWVHLPPGTRIDTADMDGWVYPPGTKIWKEFTIDGTRIETRLLEKLSGGSWNLVAYQWLPDQSDALAVPDGVPNAAGTDHDIPSSADCQRCHGGLPDSVLGFTALQLAHAGDGVTLEKLASEDRLTKPPAAPIVVPGDGTAVSALLYLHANCGQCHNARELVTQQTGVNFWLTVASLGRVEGPAAYRTAVNDVRHGVQSSQLLLRMRHRGNGQMPPLASKHVDDEGTAAVTAWLTSLAPASDGGGDGSVRDAARD